MVRKTYTRHINHSAKLYKQRSSAYVRRTVDGRPKLHLELAEYNSAQNLQNLPINTENSASVPPQKKAPAEEKFVFPAKLPTPSIVKRTNGVLPHQRVRTAL